MLFRSNLDSASYVNLPNSYHGKIVQAGAKAWKKILEEIDKIDAGRQKFYQYQIYNGGDWLLNKSRALKKNDWNSLAGNSSKPVFYFTLPDPWQIYLDSEKNPEINSQDPNLDLQLKKRNNMLKLQKTAWNEALNKKNESAGVSGGEVLFNQYFAKLMTDPAWPLPYNHSLRYAVADFKNYYFRKEGDQEGFNRDEIMKEAFPEFRDAIGYYDSRKNPYLVGSENEPLNNKMQKAIIKHYKQKPKTEAYFFVAETKSSKSLEELEFDFFKGRCMYSFANQKDFDSRFRPDGTSYNLGSSACVRGGLKLVNARFDKGGVVYVTGTISIEGDLSGGDGLALMAKAVSVEGNGQLDNVSIIQDSDQEFIFKAKTLNGNLVTRGPVKVDGFGERVLKYNNGLKQNKYLVGFQSYIDSWKWEYAGASN